MEQQDALGALRECVRFRIDPPKNTVDLGSKTAAYVMALVERLRKECYTKGKFLLAEEMNIEYKYDVGDLDVKVRVNVFFLPQDTLWTKIKSKLRGLYLWLKQQ